ncbi:MAG: FG-GAP repeat domain-containing protein [Planctomycetaceae bacterium]
MPGRLSMVALLLAVPAACAADPVTFRRIVLTEAFQAEAAGMGDIDRDGHGDAVYGPFWYAGPDFTTRHAIYPARDFDPAEYSDNFMTVVADVDADGWPDVLVNEWPGKAVHWFRNPGKEGLAAAAAWTKHLAHPVVDNEAPDFLDVTGDGRPELVFHTGGVLGYAEPGANPAADRWTFHPCSEPEKWGQYQHGLGAGDVDGDGRTDLLMLGGWWGQPADRAGPWAKHPQDFGTQGGAQMHVSDVDGDGDGDVITSLAGHGYGLSWYEQVGRDGRIEFVERPILPAKAEESLNGVQFSQVHAVAVADIDGDGAKDIVTGKRWWAHGPKGDPDPQGTPVLYWFRLIRTPAPDGGPATVSWEPHRIDDATGVGTQIAVGDLNADGRPDVVVGNKRGGAVFLQETRPK